MKFFSWIGLMIALFSNGAVMQDKAQTLRHETAAVIKLVPLRVLDPEGRSVKGLRIEDFSVRDNGILKKITEFEVHDRWLSMENEPPFPRVDIRSDVYRKIFLLFDMHGGDEAGLANAKAAARYFIRTAVVQSDETGILAYESLTGFRVEEWSGANTGGPAISLISLYPLIFRDRIPLIGAWIGRMKTVWALLPLRLKDIADPEVEIRIRIRNGDGEAYPIDSKILEAQERENSLSVLSLEIYPPDLKEGQYELTIEAVEIKTGASASISRTFIKR